MMADGDSDMDISAESTTEADKQPKEQGEHALLDPPIINTKGKIATGATTTHLRKQNKLLRNNILREHVDIPSVGHAYLYHLQDCVANDEDV
jgi:hypothetical protein